MAARYGEYEEAAGHLARGNWEPSPRDEQSSYEPYRAPSRESDVGVPLLQAVILGVCVGLSLCGVAFWLNWQTDARGWLKLFTIPAILMTTGAFLWRVGWISENTLYKAETLTKADLNRDGAVGEPPHAASVGRSREANANTIDREKNRLSEFISVCCDHNTDIRTLRQKGFSDQEIARYRALLMRPDVGIARWNGNGHSHQSGWHMVKPREEALAVASRLLWLPGQKRR